MILTCIYLLNLRKKADSSLNWKDPSIPIQLKAEVNKGISSDCQKLMTKEMNRLIFCLVILMIRNMKRHLNYITIDHYNYKGMIQINMFWS